MSTPVTDSEAPILELDPFTFTLYLRGVPIAPLNANYVAMLWHARCFAPMRLLV